MYGLWELLKFEWPVILVVIGMQLGSHFLLQEEFVTKKDYQTLAAQHTALLNRQAALQQEAAHRVDELATLQIQVEHLRDQTATTLSEVRDFQGTREAEFTRYLALKRLLWNPPSPDTP